jgi:phosphinothricin acetyltransferase
MNLQFEELKEHHLPEIKSIYDWFIKNSTATFHTEPIQIDQLKEFIYIGHPLYKSYLIKSGNDLVGYCILTNHKKRQAYDRTAEITIYLKPEFHKKGIGQVAMQHLEKQAKSLGLKNLIGVITGDNASSIALFEKAGYTKCAHYKNIGEKFGKVLDVVAYQKEI